jgi:hypothetical protein
MFYKIYRTITSILILNFKILKLKILDPKKKILIFFHPKKKLTNITMGYIEFLLSDTNTINTINCIGHKDQTIEKKNYIFISQRFVNYILFADYFLSTYMCDYFPPNCKKIYMHHDIYDTPVVDNVIQKKFLLRLNNYDYIFLPNDISKKYFKKLFFENRIKEKVKYFISGYLKLQFLRSLKTTNKRNKIILAPTNIYSFDGLTLLPHLKKIISFLLANTKHLIILRPHPSNREDLKFLTLKKYFKKNVRFKYDDKESYHKNYTESFFMITDLSGTAYTYCFLTKNPVIFFNDRNLLKKNFFLNLNYFKDIKKVGYDVKNLNDLKKALKSINKIFYQKKINITKLERQRFEKMNPKKTILQFLNNS